MKIGLTLPTFTLAAATVMSTALEAEQAGIDGLFCFDHVYPLGHPERPSLSLYPVLGAVAAVTNDIRLGSLVARIGMVPDEAVVASLESLQLMTGGRLIAGLGTGDSESAPEHEHYGLPFLAVREREESLARVLCQLTDAGIECWVGAGSGRGKGPMTPTLGEAIELGATVNYWQISPAELARAASGLQAPFTWGGPLPKTAREAAAVLVQLKATGASWAIWAWPPSVELVAEACGLAGVALSDDSGERSVAR